MPLCCKSCRRRPLQAAADLHLRVRVEPGALDLARHLVVKVLIAQGIPAQRLAATGFGQFQPLDDGDDEIAFRRNRRIELNLTQR